MEVLSQYLLIVAMVIIGLAIGISLKLVGYQKGQALSLHIASKRQVYLLYASIMTTGVVTLGIFGYLWLVPQLGLSWPFLLVYFLGLACVIFTAWVPDVPGWQRVPHYVAAYGIVAVSPLIEIALLMTRGNGMVVSLIIVATLALQAYILYLFFFVLKARDRFAVYQVIYIAAFFVALLAVTYLR